MPAHITKKSKMKTYFLLLCTVLAAIFLTAPAQAVMVTFAGDYGANDNTKKALQRIDTFAPEVHFAMGDLSYAELSETAWCEMVKGYVKIPFLLVPGNHESDGINGDIANFAKCLPYSYRAPFSGEYPNQSLVDIPAENPVARFIMISPNLAFSDKRHYEYTGNSQNLLWLKAAIEDGRKKGLQWIIVGMHKVCITAEGKGCEVSEELVNTLIHERVDMVLQGHVHSYERTFPLICIKALAFDSRCVASTSEKDYVQGVGTVFVTGGTGGMPARHINQNDVERPYFVKAMGANEGITSGLVTLDISKTEIRQTFVDASSGKVLDSFVIRAK